MSRETRDQAIYDDFAAHHVRKDVLPASATARRSQLFSALGDVLMDAPNLGTVVEIGCGVGAPARYLWGRYEHYIGLDHSTEMVRAARAFNAGNERASFIAANARQTPLPPQTADLILSIGAIHHMPDLDAVMAHLVTLAKPGATLVAREPQRGNPFIQGMRWLRARMEASYSEEQTFFAAAELVELFERHGLRITAVEYQGFFTPPFAQVVMNPQSLTAPLSQAAAYADNWLHNHLWPPLKPLSFNLAIRATFPSGDDHE